MLFLHKLSRLQTMLGALCGFILLLSNASNPPTGHTGAPFNSNCTDCHAPTNNNFNGNVTINGLPSTIIAGTTYSLTLTGNVTSGTPSRAGFQLVMVDNANANAGSIASGTGSATENVGGRTYLEHRGARLISGGQVSWNFNWTAPSSASGNTIKAYVALNLVNNNGGTNGDRVLNQAFTIPFSAAPPPPALEVTAVVSTHAGCNGDQNGSASASATGGLEPYTFEWSNLETTADIAGLIAGVYTVTVTDAAGVQASASVTILEPDAIEIGLSASNELDCTHDSVDLTTDAQGGTGALTYLWTTGETTPNITVTSPGIYSVTVTDENSCFKSASETVAVVTNVDISATGGVLGCDVTPTQIFASSTNPDITYSWVGPNGFSSTEQNPVVGFGGIYTVTATDLDGCTASDTAEVLNIHFSPALTIGGGGTLNCTTTSVTLMAMSSVPDLAFSWVSFAGFTSTEQNPVVSLSDYYTVTATTPFGCSSAQTIFVPIDIAQPDLVVAGTSINCANPSGEISATSSAVGVNYAWSDGGSFSSTLPNPQVTESGVYTVEITAPNGCTNTDSVVVSEDFVLPDLAVTGGTLGCNALGVEISAVSSTPNVTFAWSGPDGFVSDEANPTVSVVGNYNVTATAPNGCSFTYFAEVNSSPDVPSLSASGGAFTCAAQVLQLIASTDASDATFVWTGPNGFTTTEQSPFVSVAGTYSIVVTNVLGCSVTQNVAVLTDPDIPVFTIAGGEISCLVPSVTLMLTTANNSLSYAWTGPNGFSSTEQNPAVSNPGTYTVVASSAGGCSSSLSTQVTALADIPQVIASGGILNCVASTLQLAAQSSIAGSTFSWTGPNGFTSDEQNPFASEVGTYSVVVSSPDGCTAIGTAIVDSDINAPNVVATGGNITCLTPTVILMATSSDLGVTFDWGASGTTVSSPGIYTVTATGSNGCTATAIVDVLIDVMPPSLSISGNTTLTCANTCTELTAQSEPSVLYSWFGGGLTSTNQTVEVCTPGQYTVIATAANGCTTTETADVITQADFPLVDIIGNTRITCADSCVELTALSSNTPNAIIAWFNGQTTSSITVCAEGTVTVIVTDPTSGCSTTRSVDVKENVDVPDVSATGGILSCLVSEVTLSVTSSNPDVTFAWSPAGPVVNEAGVYTVTATAPNGCTATTTAEVVADAAIPNVTISGNQVITCATPCTDLIASSNIPNATFQWSSPSGNQSGATWKVCVPATYVVVVTDPATGCANTATLDILADVVPPSLSVSGNITLTCGNTCTELTAQSNPSVLYSWTGNGSTSTNQTIEVCTPGQYTVVATAANGCTASQAVQVVEDYNLILEIVQQINPSCYNSTDGSAQIRLNDTLITIGNLGSSPQTLTFSNPIAACSGSITVTPIAPDSISTNLVVVQPAIFGTGSISTQISGGTAPYVVIWTKDGAPYATTPNISNLADGIYALQVIDANDCTSFSEVTIRTEVSSNDFLANAGLTVFPNPSSSFVFFTLKNKESLGLDSIIRFKLFNSLGAMVLSGEEKLLDNGLNISHLPQGAYALQMFDPTNLSKSTTVRLQKQ